MTSWRKRLARWRRSLASGSGDGGASEARTLIRDSGLFDAAWYLARYPDVAAAGLDPLDHFVIHGGAEGRKASPEFDSRWYVSRYPDAAASSLHPLVHFLKHGQGREATKRIGPAGIKSSPGDLADAAEIMSSPLFDAAWYTRENQLDTAGHGTALHYLKIGGIGGLPASPAFDSAAYLRTYGDVREAGQNPLLHYIRHGAREGRKTFAVTLRSAEHVQPFVARDLRRINRPEPDEHTPWVRSADLKAQPGRAVVRLGGIPAGLLPEVYGDHTAPLPADLGAALSQFCALRGLDASTFAAAKSARRTRLIPDTLRDSEPNLFVIVDGWFVNDSVLRLRLEGGASDGAVRLFQVRRGGQATLIGEAQQASGSMHLVDATLLNVFQPVLVVHVDADGFINGGGLIPFPSLYRGGAHAGEVAVHPDGATAQAKRDSLSGTLLRDSLGWARAPAQSLGKVVVDLKGATGMERIFSSSALEWLSESGVTIEAGNVAVGTPPAVADHLRSALQPSAAQSATSTRGGGILTLPCDALPSLAVLTSRRVVGSSRAIGAYVMCDSTLPVPRWLVAMPDLDQGLLKLQPASAVLPFPLLSRFPDATPVASSRTGVVALRYRDPSGSNEAVLTFPVAPDASGPLFDEPLSARRRAAAAITAVIRIDDALVAVGLLESLARQTMADRLNITAATAGDEDVAAAVKSTLERLFPARHNVILADEGSPAQSINAAVSQALPAADMLLFVRQDMTLHDPRTLEALYLMAARPGTATASCVTVRDGGFRDGAALRFKAGGIFPSRLSFATSPSLAFARPETLGAFPMATYPVAGNMLDLAMISVGAWQEAKGLDAVNYPFDGYALDFALRTLKAGLTHLCTSVVTVTDGGDGSIDHRADMLSADSLAIDEWAQALKRVTLLRALD